MASVYSLGIYCPDGEYVPVAEVYARLGRMYFDGIGVEEDTAQASMYFEIAHEKGSRDMLGGDYLMMGMYRLLEVPAGVRCGLTKDVSLAIKWFLEGLKTCIRYEDTHWRNLLYSHIGRALLDDEIRDYENAFLFLTIAAVQEPEAMFYLAIMYDRGLYVEEDRVKAVYCLEQILDATDLEGDVFYEAAGHIMACWETGAPEEIIEGILQSLG